LKAVADYLQRAQESVDDETVQIFHHIAQEEFKHAAMHIAKLTKCYEEFGNHLWDFIQSDNIVKLEESQDEKPQD
jgi:hypothetical protein